MSLDSTMQGAEAPAERGAPGVYDRNTAPDFNKPRSSGGIPVKFYEDIPAQPAPLDTTLEDKNLVR